MSWKFPHFIFPNGSVVGIEDFNRGFQVVAGEIGGRLNEHNWRLAALRSGVAGNTGGTDLVPPPDVGNGFRDTCEPDTAYNWWRPGLVVGGGTWELYSDIGHDIIAFLMNPITPAPDPDNQKDTPETLGWGSVLTATITSDGGALWIMASFQLFNHSQPTDYAIRVDGAVVGESKAATSELENDIKGAINYPNLYPLTIDTIVEVTDGPHVVELISRELENINESAFLDGAQSQFGNRSLLVLEIRR